MFGRLVDQYVWGEPSVDAAYVWGDTRRLLLEHDLRLINLECVVSTLCDESRRASKTFTFGARPRAMAALAAARVDFVSLANNHVLDYGPDALEEMLSLLDRDGIAWAGAGRDRREALRPAALSAGDAGIGSRLTVGVIGLTDNEPGWEAQVGRPGVTFVDYDERGLKEPYCRRVAESVEQTKQRVDLVVVSAHVGPNWGEPSRGMQALAHQLIDLGADLYWGHSNHATRGIEVYAGRPVLYSTGDFVDDYAVDPAERNDLSFLFGVVVQDKRIRRLVLYPVKIDHLQVNRAPADDAAWVNSWMRARCALFGTSLVESEGTLALDLA
jgi:poly-gamma-glutamate synthesis protein (capsule biosynthesis protein)